MNSQLVPAETPDVLSIENLTVSYTRRRQELVVLSDLSFRIAPGEAYGLVGESGCGKTTVAMALMRYLPSNATVKTGRVEFRGQDVLGATKSELQALRGNRIAMVYQHPASALDPSMTVGNQIAEVYRYHLGMNKRDALAAAAEMLDSVHMPNAPRLLRRYPHELSGGQQQRVMIAMALATNPDLLVLDEPTTGLDATVEAEVLDLIGVLRERYQSAILFISHNLGVVASLCDRVGVLYAGRLVEEGRARASLLDPRHPYTVGLLQSVPRRGMRKDAERLIPIPGALPILGREIVGCAFQDRCPIVREDCRVAPIPLVAVRSGLARCIHHEDVVRIPRASPTDRNAPTPDDGELLLDLRHVTKAYDTGGARVVAVDDVSLSIVRGEVLGVVGESGSGKTTLAKCIAGLTRPTDGEMTISGRSIPLEPGKRDQEMRRQVQMVFQNPDGALNPRLSIRRMIERSVKLLSPTKMSARERELRVSELADAVRLPRRYLDLTPDRLSGGLKQRVAIARALAGAPSLVICDEPTSALDVSVQASILNLLADIQSSKGVSYLFISHDLATVRYLADTVAVMYLGQVVEYGRSNDVFAPPFHPYTEALISSIPSIQSGEHSERITLDGPIPDPAHPPTGCRFHTRCPRYLGEICETESPPWQDGEGSHRYRCHIPPAELTVLQRDRLSAAAGRGAI